jgi:hypothetical protein
MWYPSWLRNRQQARRTFLPRLEVFEDRTLPSAVSFSVPTTYAVTSGGSSVAMGDFNGNGKLDLAVASEGSNSVGVLLGNGDGTFQAPQNFAAGYTPVSVAIGDFDGRHYANGQPIMDLAVANLNTNTVSVLLGNGDGTFQTAKSYAVGNNPNSIAVGDFDGDGTPDLAVTNQSSATVSVLLGNGDGTFRTAQSYAVGFSPTSVAVGDFNRDSKPDLAVANSGSNSVSVLLGNGDGTFQPAQNIAFAYGPTSVVAGDFNGDGKPDLAVSGALLSNQAYVSVLLGNGDGTFQPAQNIPFGYITDLVAVGDLNGDGNLDLVTANPFNNNVGVLLGNGDGSFQGAQNFAVGSFPHSVAVGNFDGRHYANGQPILDLAVASGSGVSVLLNQPLTTTLVSGPASSTYAQSVTYTATVTSGATPVTAGTVTFLDGNTPISAALALTVNGQASFSIATLNAGSHTITASYSGTPGGLGDPGLSPSTASTSLLIAPLPLSASAVNFAATAGAPFSGTVASFSNADPFGSAASYTATIDWGDGSTSPGTISGTGTLTVSGSHTYATAGSYAATVQISHNLGDTTTATVYPSATVTNLGQAVQDGLTGGIGFWNNKNGQRLIDSFNGGPTATALSSWLATTFPNLYGANAGANNLTGYSNAQVAAFYQSQFALPGSNLEAQVLATALNVYATTQSLGGTNAQAYGFSVSADGLGAYSYNVGSDGAAFGVANNTILNVYDLLQAVNQQAVNGVLYNGNTTLRKQASDLFGALIQAGSIS